jgi:hypothetical protein
MLPFTIQGETRQNGNGKSAAPRKGTTFACESGFQWRTSLWNSWTTLGLIVLEKATALTYLFHFFQIVGVLYSD